MKRRSVWHYIGYFGFIYLLIMGVLWLGYPTAQQYAKPFAALIFPINENNSIGKTLLVTSGMYWLMVGGYLWVLGKR